MKFMHSYFTMNLLRISHIFLIYTDFYISCTTVNFFLAQTFWNPLSILCFLIFIKFDFVCAYLLSPKHILSFFGAWKVLSLNDYSWPLITDKMLCKERMVKIYLIDRLIESISSVCLFYGYFLIMLYSLKCLPFHVIFIVFSCFTFFCSLHSWLHRVETLWRPCVSS